MFEQTQFDLLRSWVIAATELDDVILAFPSAPRPTTDYGLLNLTRSDTIGRPVEIQFENNPDHTGVEDDPETPAWEFVTQEYEFIWSLQIYANDPVNVANRLRPWFHLNSGREMLAPLNVFSLGSVLRVPEKVNQNWQDRATTEIKVRAYVCTGTTNYGNTQVLLGRVPVDLVEIIDFTVDSGITNQTEQVTKP